ncbi:MAG: VTT domain-containing protein [Patescibacteria group bacterium]
MEDTKPSAKEAFWNLGIIAVTVGVAYIITVTVGLDTLRDKVADAGIFAPLIVILLKATTIVVAPLGGAIIYPISGAVFGFWTGFAYVFLGDLIGSTIAFFISRFFGRSVLNYFTSTSQRPMVDQVLGQLGDKWSFAKARVYFMGFMDLFAYAAGLTRIPYWYYIVVHMAVQVPFIVLYTAFGDVIVSGNWYAIAGIGIGFSVLAIIGAYRMKIDIVRGN